MHATGGGTRLGGVELGLDVWVWRHWVQKLGMQEVLGLQKESGLEDA